ncbi:hypothetical protein NIES4101_77730 [Calothrix sp. NIES-4101]|nr:hypothetical protein NIES4101_77730 [Calothrix sp. NIES-4101]
MNCKLVVEYQIYFYVDSFQVLSSNFDDLKIC